MHGAGCEGIWSLSGDAPFRAHCPRCGLVVMSRAAWAAVDPEAFTQAVDPDGLQRAFLEAAGLPVPGRRLPAPSLNGQLRLF